jgi:hypothetical protein
MRLGRRAAKPDPFGPNGAWVRELVELIGSLTPDEARRVEELVLRERYVVSRECDIAAALVQVGALHLKLALERDRAKWAATRAMGQSAGGRGCSLYLTYAAGLLAEAFVAREAVDPETWAYVTRPWGSIIEIPPLYEGDEPANVAWARDARRQMEKVMPPGSERR